MTTATARERVPAFSATAYLRLAAVNRGWLDLSAIDRTALKRLSIEADDRGFVRVSTRHTRASDCPLCSASRLREAGFLRTLPRGGTGRLLVLPAHRAFLVALDARREAWRESTPSGRRFYELLGYGAAWVVGRRRVAADVARILRVAKKQENKG